MPVMRGDWPKNGAATVATQELANDATDRLEAELAGIENRSFHTTFRRDGFPDKWGILSGLCRTRVSGLLQLPREFRRASVPPDLHVALNIIPCFSLCGDFDIDVSFDRTAN